MVRLSLVFPLHLRLPHSSLYSHLWLSKDISISTLQCKLKPKKCLPWVETLTWMLSWAFPFPHRHLPHHPLQFSVNSEEISNLDVKGIHNRQYRLTFLDMRAFLGFASSPASSFFVEARFFLGFGSSVSSSPWGLRAVSGMSSSAT